MKKQIFQGGYVVGRGCAGRRGIKGQKWDNCNSTINKIYLKKQIFLLEFCNGFLKHSHFSKTWRQTNQNLRPREVEGLFPRDKLWSSLQGCPTAACGPHVAQDGYVLGTACLVSEAVTPPWLRLSDRPWDPKPLRRQSLSPWQGCYLCPLYFTLLGPKPDQLANDG